MAGGERAVAVIPRDVDHLLVLALSRPQEALASARSVLAGRPGPHEASVAHQAAGIVLRDFGDVEAAIREFREALHFVELVAVAGGVPAASAKAPAKNKQRIGTACFKAGFPMYFHIGHKVPHFSRSTFSVRNSRTLAQLQTPPPFLIRTTGPTYRR